MGRTAVVVVPCFNEAQRLRLDRIRQHAKDYSDTGFLFVDDGSTDSTREVLEDAAKRNPEIFEVLSLPTNQGKAEAVRSGINKAMADGAKAVAYWDADLSTPLHELRVMLKLLDADPETQGVLASRVKLLGRRIERNPFRHYFGRIFATCASLVLKLPVYDTQCGAKVFSVSNDLATAFSDPFQSGWIFDVELIGRLEGLWGEKTADRLREHPVQEWVDIAGSKVRPYDFVMSAFHLLKIWRGIARRKTNGERENDQTLP